jgi:hypothetical protein
MRVHIAGVGVLSAGLDGWVSGREVLAGKRPFRVQTVPDPESTLLPANERRRSTASVRWAVRVAQEAMAQSSLDPRSVATVFASSGGEMGVLDQLCRALTTAERIVSPTVFHQSVHNTAAGYWGIATSCQQSSTALSCYDDSCAAGLLEAVTHAATEDCPVLFVSYDLPAPEPLIQARPIQSAFAAALVLTTSSAAETCPAATVTVASSECGGVTTMADGELERLRVDNPSARLLPVLYALAVNGPAMVRMNMLDDQRLVLKVESRCL